jgi:FlaA1/EpsC-like NDP-sugar epimerase
MAVALPLFIVSGLYRAIFRYAGWPALMAVAKAIWVYGVVYAALFTAIGFAGIPRTIGLIQPLLLLFAIGASRALARQPSGLYQTQLKLVIAKIADLWGWKRW